MVETVAVTGGNGTIGEAILEELNDAGYRSVNVARGKRREEVSEEYRRTDLLDPGEVYGSLAAAGADAVIHMGTIPGAHSHPDYRVYESNAMSSFHVLEAATGLGIDSVVLPSSINAMGSAFQDARSEVYYLPVDEEHPLTPRDPYALGKQAIEMQGDGFARRPDGPETIASLRFPGVHSPESVRSMAEGDRSSYDRDSVARDDLFTYCHLADAARAARLAVEADYAGHEVFWVVADETKLSAPTPAVAADCYPDAEVREDLAADDGLVTVEKARELLGWDPEHSWRDHRG
jgi:nucleoside-diphosphate-sugar epimerase